MIWYIDKGVPNGKCESLREGGQASFFGSARHFQFLICETETSKRLKSARLRHSDFKTFRQQLWKQQQQQKKQTNKEKESAPWDFLSDAKSHLDNYVKNLESEAHMNS